MLNRIWQLFWPRPGKWYVIDTRAPLTEPFDIVVAVSEDLARDKAARLHPEIPAEFIAVYGANKKGAVRH